MHIAYVLFGVPKGFLGGGIPLCLRSWIKILCNAGHRVSVVSVFGDPNEQPLAPNCDYYHVPFRRMLPGRFRLVNDILKSRSLATALKESNLLRAVNAVDVQECQIAPFVFPLCDRKGVKKVHSVHLSALAGQERFKKAEAQVHKYFNLKAALSADGVVAVSNWIKGLYVANKVPTNKIHVVYNAVDIPLQPSRAQRANEVNVLWVGRFTEAKGVLVATRACLLTLEIAPNLRFTFVGDGPLMGEVKILASKAPPSLFRFTGHLTDPFELERHRAEADIYLFTSIHETFGRTLAEGMASGLGCVATDHPVMREVMGESGLYFEKGSERNLVDRIFELAEDRDMRVRLGLNARERAKQLFSEEAVSGQLLGSYEAILS